MLFKYIYKPFFFLLFLLYSIGLSASHYYGVDLYYTHVSGNTYKVTIVSYGDCSGQAFPTFPTSRPRVYIMKGNTQFLVDYLDLEPPTAGVEVTPVCPADLDKTTCVSPAGSVPGVKKFVYSKQFTLSGPASDWKFVYSGRTDGTTSAGRSNTLSNIYEPGRTIITVEATLDNTEYPNSSPVYTTIATPFYCINRPVNFNPGAVDADGDSLVYQLVPALDTMAPVYYRPGFSGSNPLDVATGKFSFSSNTGQLNFTPDNLQKSLVVYRVSEYRNGKLIGTSMREMTVVILPCDNNPPAGYITNASGATIVDTVTVKTCKGNHELAFEINPADADNGNIISMEVNGLPGDSKLNITDNKTTRPKSRFSWKMPDLSNGDYTFYVTYTDDGCPIASKQTQAYTIRITPDSISSSATDAPCEGLGLVTVTSPQSWSPWAYQVYNGATHVFTKGGIGSTSRSDSIAAGKYRIQATNYFGCTAETVVEVPFSCYLADIPTAFSPNSDGQNDILYVLGQNIKEIDLRIYNRWGSLVFESHDAKTGWNGKYNAADAPLETYAYVLSVVFTNGQGFYKKGNITLIR